MARQEKEKTEEKTVIAAPENVDANDYKELFAKLRTTIGASKDSYKSSLIQTKEMIIQKEDELNLLRIRQHKLEGAIEASDGFLSSVLPNNNKLLSK